MALIPVTTEELAALIQFSAESGEVVCGVLPSGSLDADKCSPRTLQKLLQMREPTRKEQS